MAAASELLQKARTYLEKGEYTNAEQAYQAVVKADPRNAEALAECGRFAMMREDVTEGLRLVEQALAVQPKLAQALAYKGLGFSLKEDFANAILLFEEAVKIDPALVMAWHNLARAYRKQGQWEKAEAAVRQALKLKPNDFQSHYELSTILANTNRMPEAIREALESIRINPLYLKGYLTLGKAYELGGRSDLVIQLYREGLRHIPGTLILREELVRLLILSRNFKEAYAERAIITQQRNTFENNLELGNLAVLGGDFTAAEKAYKRAAQLKPDASGPHFNLGELYNSGNLKKEAKAEYMEAIRLNDRDWKPFNSLGTLLMKDETAGSFRKAIEYLQEASARNPNAPEPYFNLAQIYGHNKNKAEAEKFAQLALSKAREDGVLRRDIERLLGAIKNI